MEYILIDGGSTDGTLKILDRYKSKFKYFKSSNDKGVYDAMNKGILQASGDLIGFVNGGDFIYENTLHNINELFSRQKSNLLFSVADIDYIDNENNIVGSKICPSKEQIIKKNLLKCQQTILVYLCHLEHLKNMVCLI